MTIAPPIDDEKAYSIWFESYRHNAADTDISPYLKLTKKVGWLRKVREALLVSTNQAAQRMGISKTTHLDGAQKQWPGLVVGRAKETLAARR